MGGGTEGTFTKVVNWQMPTIPPDPRRRQRDFFGVALGPGVAPVIIGASVRASPFGGAENKPADRRVEEKERVHRKRLAVRRD